MKKIPLTQGKFTLVDNEDYTYLMQWKWYCCSRKNTHTCYAYRNAKKSEGRRRTYSMHQQLLGRKKGFEIDHLDGDGLNNTRKNLRWCTPAQNKKNRGLLKTKNTSGLKGVSYLKTIYGLEKPWYARIKHNGKKICLGYFKTPEEAHEAYKKAAIKYHREFARW